MQPPVRVCFVCLGNICRSPTAEGVMRKVVMENGLDDQIEVESAGTAAYHVGERADKRSRQFASRRGIALDSRARQFEAGDFQRFEYVLAMDRDNLSDLEALTSESAFAGHLSLFRDFDSLAPRGSEVPDPYYGGDRGFEEVLDQCESACLGLIETMRRDGRFA